MAEDKRIFGEDCPKGMVQVEFVGIDPSMRQGNYGYIPTKSAFIEVYVDGKRFRLDIGDVIRADGTKERGIHICGPINLVVDKHSLNAVDIFYQEGEG